jgi:peptidoglycan L-alanyl-D-glutamate endopeptidase CwlK
MKPSEKSIEKADRDINLLAPFFYARVKASIDECAARGINLWIVEAYRDAKRQNWLYASGRTRDGHIVTKSQGWQSMHQYGLAVDLCGGSNKKPIWTMPWDKIRRIFELNGLQSLAPFEQAHFEINGGFTTKQLYEMAHSDGIEAVWAMVEKSIVD